MEAFFLPLERGQRFCLLHRPAKAAPVHGAILFIHPFAEEMNKCRRMAALQARAFAEAGWIVLQIDLYGCGDSSGDFGDATWQQWLDDVKEGATWLAAEAGHPPMFWGLRTGCLLAAEAAGESQVVPQFLFWQPTLSGKQVLQQFLRLKVINQMLGAPPAERTGTQKLREQLARGKTIEVAGYALSPGLALGLEAAELNLPIGCARVAWLEVAAATDAGLSPAARARIEAWQGRGHRVDARTVEGCAFWQTVEVGECPALIKASVAIINGWRS
jgi:exosortase A-associated hydrolase 2